jgi:hypothetical protein
VAAAPRLGLSRLRDSDTSKWFRSAELHDGHCPPSPAGFFARTKSSWEALWERPGALPNPLIEQALCLLKAAILSAILLAFDVLRGISAPFLARDWTTSTPFANSVILSSNILPTWIRGCADALGLIAGFRDLATNFAFTTGQKTFAGRVRARNGRADHLNYYRYVSINYRNFFGLSSARERGR